MRASTACADRWNWAHQSDHARLAFYCCPLHQRATLCGTTLSPSDRAAGMGASMYYPTSADRPSRGGQGSRHFANSLPAR